MDAEQLKQLLPGSIGARIESLRLDGARALLVVDATGLDEAGREAIERDIIALLKGAEGIEDVRVALTAQRSAPMRHTIIAIGSGKGGVGKSTLTANLAVALARRGRKVGIVDADIYGPSQPRLLGIEGVRPQSRGEQLVPVSSPHSVRLLSMGQLVKPAQALAWRGPMAVSALAQLVDAAWDDTEILLVDLPPGTGDVQLSMLQKHRPAGAIIVSTPQDLALMDAARAGQLFEAGKVEIIGLVENMAGYCCPHCGETSDPFGQGGVEAVARRLEIPFLGRIPLALEIRSGSDEGNPPVLGEGAEAGAFEAVAGRLSDWLDQHSQEAR